jgi:hypothetical protein
MRDHPHDYGTLGAQWVRDREAEAMRQDAEELAPPRLPPGSGIAIAAVLSAALWCFVAAAVLAARIWG